MLYRIEVAVKRQSTHAAPKVVARGDEEIVLGIVPRALGWLGGGDKLQVIAEGSEGDAIVLDYCSQGVGV